MTSRSRPKGRSGRFPALRPRLEPLEDRLVLSASITAGGLEFLTAAGFTASGSTETASGQVDVGFAPQSGQKFQPLLTLTGGATVDTSALTFSDSGSVVATIAGTPVTLFSGPVSLNIPSLLGSGLGGLAGSSLKVAGVNFTLDSIALTPSDPSGLPAIEVQGSIALPGGLGVGVDGSNDVILDANGISLTGVDATVSGSLKLGGEAFASANLTATYSSTTNTFSVVGTTSLMVEGNSVAVTFGGPSGPNGLVIQNGSVTSLDMVVDSNLSVGGLGFTTTGLELDYVPASNEFSMTGNATFTVDSDSIGVTFDTPNDPMGLVVQGGAVTSLGMIVDSNLAIDGLTFTTNQLTMDYTPSSHSFAMTGSAALGLGGSSLSTTFGGTGLVITNGHLTSLDVSASGTFSMLGLAIAANNLEVQLDTSSNVYRFGGTVSVSTAAQGDGGSSFQSLSNVSATLGSAQTVGQAVPQDGLVLANGKVTEFNLQLDGSINLFGLGLTFNDLALDYNAGAGTLVISGGASLAFGPFSGVSINVPNQGLTISTTTGAVHVAGLDIAFNVGLGGGGSKQFGFQGDFDFSDTGSGSSEVQTYAASGTVDTGEGDFSGSIAITHSGGKARVNSVSIAYAAGASEGIEIDGLFLTSVTASILNIGSSSETISGSIGADYGGKVANVSLLTLSGQFTWTESELSGSVGYVLSTGVEAASSGMADLDLNFATGTYQIGLDGTAFANIFSFDLNFQINAGLTLDLSGTAGLNAGILPSWVSSFLGSNNLPSLGFAFQYVPHDNADSYGEAWVTIAGQEVGIKIDFNGNVTEIISGGLAAAFQSIANDSTMVYDETASALASAYSGASAALGTGLATTAAAFTSFEQSVATSATNSFNNAVNGATSAYMASSQYAQSTYNSLVNQASSYFNTDATTNGINQANADYQAALNNAQSTYNYYINYASTQYSTAISGATAAYQSVSPVIVNAANQAVVAASAELSSLNSAAQSQLNSLESTANSALGSLENAANQAIQAIANAAAAAAAAAASAAEAAAAKLASAAKSVKKWFSHLGYLSGAVVYYDATGKGVLEPGEAYVVTGVDGSFRPVLPANPSKGSLIVVGGVDTSTGLPNVSFAMAPGDSTFISPLTTLVSLIMKDNPKTSEKAANAMVDRSLGLPTSVNLEQEDIIARGKAGDQAAANAFRDEIAVTILIDLVSSLLAGSSGAPESTALSEDAFRVLADAISQRHKTSMDLSNTAEVANEITLTAKAANVSLKAGLASQVGSLIAGLHQIIAAKAVTPSEAYLSGIVKAQVVAERSLAPLLAEVEAGDVSIEQLIAGESPARLALQIEQAKIGTLTPRRPVAPPTTSAAGTRTDLAISSSAPANAQSVGVPELFSFTVTNRGTATAVGVTTLMDLSGLSGGTILAVAPSQGSIASNRVDFGSIAAGASASVSVIVAAKRPGKLVATAATSDLQPDTSPSNNFAYAVAEVASQSARSKVKVAG